MKCPFKIIEAPSGYSEGLKRDFGKCDKTNCMAYQVRNDEDEDFCELINNGGRRFGL